MYNLEAINLETKKVDLYYKGARGVVQISLTNLVKDIEILNKVRATDAANIGYFYSITQGTANIFPSYVDEKNESLNQRALTIIAIARGGKLTIEDKKNEISIKKISY